MAIIIPQNKNNNNEDNNNNRRNLQILIPYNISFPYFDIEGNISCYDNETSIAWDDYNGDNVTCSKSDYLLTGCSAIQVSNGRNGVYYGVKSDNGNNCYSKFVQTATSGGFESKGYVKLQARCCKAYKSKLNVIHVSKLYENTNGEQCTFINCPNYNYMKIGNAVTTGNYRINQYQGIWYNDWMWSYHGNNSNVKMSLFCGILDNNNADKNYTLNCLTKSGNIVTNINGDYSTTECPNNYKMLSCDSKNGAFNCGSNSTEYIEGSFIKNNTCHSYGVGNVAYAKCCQIV